MRKEVYLAGGCFWGVEKYFSLLKGVVATEVGYANGKTENPTYEQVCSEDTGHAETVHIIYDSDILSLRFLLDTFYKIIDPTSLNKQGGDEGTQYRTGIYYVDSADLPIIQESLTLLQAELDKKVQIEVAPLKQYFTAEAYHQKYLDMHRSGYCHIPRKSMEDVAKLEPTTYIKPERKTLKKVLTPLQYNVTQKSATERPFANLYYDTFTPGIYVDITTGEPLFTSKDKFESGCGWPSFAKPITEDVVKEKRDVTHGMSRTEVRSRFGDAHLGHVFADGPQELGGQRYCINSAAIRFIPKDEMQAQGYGEYLSLLD